MVRNLFIIDMYWLLNKAYYIFKQKDNSFQLNRENMPILIRKVFLDVASLLRKINLNGMDEVWFSFDNNGSDFRRSVYPEYKANREEKENLFRDIIDETHKILVNKKFNTIRMNGVESDDLISLFVSIRSSKYTRVVIISADKDFHQLLDKNIFIFAYNQGSYKVFTKIGEAPPLFIDNQEVVEIDPKYSLFEKLLLGDDGDNIKRIVKKGVGPSAIKKFYDKNNSDEISIDMLLIDFFNEIKYIVCEEIIEQQRLLIDLSLSHKTLSKSNFEILEKFTLDDSMLVGEMLPISSETFLKETRYSNLI